MPRYSPYGRRHEYDDDPESYDEDDMSDEDDEDEFDYPPLEREEVLIVIEVPKPILLARYAALIRQVPAALVASPIYESHARGLEPRLTSNVETTAAYVPRALTTSPDTDPAANRANFIVERACEKQALAHAMRVWRLWFDLEPPPMRREVVKLLRVIEYEQAPVVARLRAEAEAKGKEYKYWSVVSYEEWVKARD